MNEFLTILLVSELWDSAFSNILFVSKFLFESNHNFSNFILSLNQDKGIDR